MTHYTVHYIRLKTNFTQFLKSDVYKDNPNRGMFQIYTHNSWRRWSQKHVSGLWVIRDACPVTQSRWGLSPDTWDGRLLRLHVYVPSHSVLSDLCDPMDITHQAPFLCPWYCPEKNTGVGYRFLLQGIFLTQGSNPSFLQLLPWKVDSLPLSHRGSPAGGPHIGDEQISWVLFCLWYIGYLGTSSFLGRHPLLK